MLTDQQRDLLYQSYIAAAVEKEELNLVSTLGLKPFLDGNMWCFLWGEDLQNGVAGFGKTVMKAVYDFNKNFYKQEMKFEGVAHDEGK